MGKIRALITVFAAVLFSLTAVFVSAAEEDVKFSLELDKTEYAAGDAINFDMVMENAGDSEVYVNGRFYAMGDSSDQKDRDVMVEVISPSGEKLPCKYTYTTGFPRTTHFKKLKKGESVKSERPRNLKGYFDIDSPGKYTVKAVYENVYGKEIGLDAVSGPIAAEPVVFEVKPSE